MKPCVIVTGGAGYIGSHACKALATAGYLPVTYDNLSTGNRWAVRWGPLEPGDVRDQQRLEAVLEQYRPIAVMHFAGKALVAASVAEPLLYYDVNVGGTLSLLATCRAKRVGAVVLSSSCATYGVPDRIPIRETTPQAPVNPYGASKLMAERLLIDSAAAHGLGYAILRYFNAAGADPAGDLGESRLEETHLIPLALDAALGKRPPVRILGSDYPTPDGTAIRDYVHVSDLADAHVVAFERLAAGASSFALNLGSGRGHSVAEVLREIEDVSGRPVPYVPAPSRPGDPPTLVADTELARRFGIHAPRSRNLGCIIRDAYNWHRRPRLPEVPIAPHLVAMSTTGRGEGATGWRLGTETTVQHCRSSLSSRSS
jgi:UDP-arabinose 4-epimerase